MTDQLTCPWCDKEIIFEPWEYNLDDGDTKDIQCSECGKGLELKLQVHYDYSIKAINCKKHKLKLHDDFWWDNLKFTFVEFICTECKNAFYDWQLPNGKHPAIKYGEYKFVGNAIEVCKKRGIK